jgi:IclR family transcriptional regulator, mhp operon transcriptional activator
MAFQVKSLAINRPRNSMIEHSIQSVTRALEILCALNRRSYATLQSLHEDTNFPKATIHRILATLRREGYVARDPERGIYRLISKVQLLSAGFNERSLITEVGAEILRSATREIRWPLAIGTLDGTEIVVRYSTMPFSPCAVKATTVNNRHNLLESAMGTAYLANCGPEERNILLSMVAQVDERHGKLASDPRLVRDLLSAARSRGYGLRRGGLHDESATIAVHVPANGHVAGVVSLTMFRRSLSDSAIDRYLPVLQEIAGRISELLSVATAPFLPKDAISVTSREAQAAGKKRQTRP